MKLASLGLQRACKHLRQSQSSRLTGSTTAKSTHPNSWSTSSRSKCKQYYDWTSVRLRLERSANRATT